MSFPSGGAIAIYSESTATPNTSWPPSGEPPPHSTSGVPEVTAAARDARLSPHHPKFLSDGDEEEKSSPSSGDNVNFDDVGVKVTSLIRGNIHISPLINWCTLTQQVWCEWASKFAMTRDARTIPNGVSDDLIWGQRKLAFDQLVYRRFLAAENASAQSPIEGKDRRCTVIVLGHPTLSNEPCYVAPITVFLAFSRSCTSQETRDVSTFAEGDCSHERRSHHRRRTRALHLHLRRGVLPFDRHELIPSCA
jgi:hypothetical protein